MRKFIAAFFVLSLVSVAAATSIENEEVEVDLATSTVSVELEVEELTTGSLSYFTSYPVEEINAEIDGSETECQTKSLQIGSEITCEAPLKRNFTAHLEFQAFDLVDSRQRISKFQYTQNFYRPTENFRLSVILPKGAGLLNEDNSSIAVISPSNANTGSNGRRIFVEWKRKPELGETVNFQVAYENFSSPISLEQGLVIALVAAVILVTGRYTYLRMNREDIENVYGELEQDEIEVLELLRQNDGEMLQKDVVDILNYSKAKVSGIVSNLVDKNIVVKEKEGRSNKLSITRRYRG